jgi:hypothetical protein
MSEYGIEIIGTILVAIAGAIGLWAKSIATDYLNDKKKQNLAKTVVQGVEQVFKHLNGEEKLEQALEMFSDLLAEKGINISELEMRLLLESAVGEFNDVFNSKKETLPSETSESVVADEDIAEEEVIEG